MFFEQVEANDPGGEGDIDQAKDLTTRPFRVGTEPLRVKVAQCFHKGLAALLLRLGLLRLDILVERRYDDVTDLLEGESDQSCLVGVGRTQRVVRKSVVEVFEQDERFVEGLQARVVSD